MRLRLAKAEDEPGEGDADPRGRDMGTEPARRGTADGLETLASHWGMGVSGDVDEEVWARVSSPGFEAPTLPRVALQFMEMYRRPQMAFPELAALLEQDPLIASKVLTVASSPAYGGVAVPSLVDALSRLGLGTCHQIVWRVALESKVFRSRAFDGVLAQVQRHGLAVAHVAKRVAKHVGVDEGEAFLGGLLHDVGLALGVIAMADLRIAADEEAYRALHRLHQPLAAELSRDWPISDAIRAVLQDHHGDAEDVSSSIAGGAVAVTALVHVVRVSDFAVDEAGLLPVPAMPMLDRSDAAGLRSSFAALGLAPDQLITWAQEVVGDPEGM